MKSDLNMFQMHLLNPEWQCMLARVGGFVEVVVERPKSQMGYQLF